MAQEVDQFITPDGKTYNFHSHDKASIEMEGLGMPPIEYITQTSPYEHGEVLLDYRLKPRIVQFTHFRSSCSRQGYWDNRSTFIDLFRPNRIAFGSSFTPGVFRKILPTGKKRDLNVVLADGFKFKDSSSKQWDRNLIQETLQFVAHDPIIYDPDIVTKIWTIASTTESLIFPITSASWPLIFGTGIFGVAITFTYAGNWPSYPVIRLTGPMSEIRIINTSFPITVQIGYSISEGDWIDIDFYKKTITNSLGTDLIGLLSEDSEDDFQAFHIGYDPEIVGGSNTIYLYGSNALVGTTSACLTYYNRYVGF
jgi:hypothetical protein